MVDLPRIPRILNKEIVLLVGLSLATFGVFVFTRHIAARERVLEEKIAAAWFDRGMQFMQAGDTDKAIQAFHKATADVEDNQKYVLALANALAAENKYAEAEQSLLRLRELDPEDPEVNTALARLAAKQGSVQDALHYYQNALYGRWSDEQLDQRRQLRIELVRFLIAHQQRYLASSELFVLQNRTPHSAAAHLEIARLFVDADDPQHALQEYKTAADLDEKNVEALTGAGEMSFHVGDYSQAQQYLRAALEANPDSGKTRDLLTLTEMILTEDPLLPHLTTWERRERLLAGLDLSLKRLDSCLSQTSDPKATAKLQSLKSEATEVEPKLSAKNHPPDSDTAKAGVALIFRMQQAASGYCGVPAPQDQALLLIGRHHNGERP